jgi:hypothetical protein
MEENGMLTEQLKHEMFGDMTQAEIDLIYNGIGSFKGWSCIEAGLGTVIMTKGNQTIRAHRGFEVKNWIPECWKELKQKIDEIES